MSESDSEMDVSAILRAGSSNKKARKRKTSSGSLELPIYGKHGTPMVDALDDKEWEKWKKNELEKVRRQDMKRARRPLFKKDTLPEKSDSHHYPDRAEHRRMNKLARKKVIEGLDEINEDGLNVAQGSDIAIRINGKDVPKKKCRKLKKAIEKELERLGNPTQAEIFSEDEDDKEFNKMWEPEGEQIAAKMDKIREWEIDLLFDPYDEFCDEMEEKEKEHKIDEQHFKKWLEKKIKKGKVSWKFKYYCEELDKINEKKGQKSGTSKTKFKSLVKDVQNFYRNLKDGSSTK